MRRAVICATAGLAGVAIGFGLNSATSRVYDGNFRLDTRNDAYSICLGNTQSGALRVSSSPANRRSKLRFHCNLSLEARNSFDGSAATPLVASARRPRKQPSRSLIRWHHSRKLSREIDDERSSFRVSPLVFVCVQPGWRHACKTMKGSLSFGAMLNARAVNCSVFGARAL